jgi:integrase
MASVFKRTRWVDAEGRKCRRGTPGARKVKSRFWTVSYIDADGRQRRRRAYTDRTASLALGADLERAKARGEADLVDRFAPHRKRPLAEHVADYIDHLRALRRDEQYIKAVSLRLGVLLRDCRWRTTADVTAASFIAWRAKGREVRRGVEKVHRTTDDDKALVGPVTLNRFLEAARSFCAWMVKPAKRMASNPLADVEKVDPTGDVRRARRALTADQVAALLKAVAPHHQRVYRAMLVTGLRRQEAEDLVWGDVRLQAPRPFVQLRAVATKSRRADTLPLRDDLAAELRADRGDAGDDAKVFAAVPSVDDHRTYLEAAGIPFRDGDGYRADVHALRHTYGTLLSVSGASPRETMELMRHTDLRLTMRVYTDPRAFNLAGAVERLPLPSPGGDAAAAVATGTTGPEKSGTKSGTTKLAATGGNRRQLAGIRSHLDARNPLKDGGHRRRLALTGCDMVTTERVGIEPTSDVPDSAGKLGSADPGAPKAALDAHARNVAEVLVCMRGTPPPAPGTVDVWLGRMICNWHLLPLETRARLVAIAEAEAQAAAVQIALDADPPGRRRTSLRPECAPAGTVEGKDQADP